MEVKSSFPLDSQVEVDQVVATWSQADEASDEECVSLYEVPTGVAVDDDAGKYQNWNIFKNLILMTILFISYQLPEQPERELQWQFSSFL